MKVIKNSGIVVFLIGLGVFIATTFLGDFGLSNEVFKNVVSNKGIKSEIFVAEMQQNAVGKTLSQFKLSNAVVNSVDKANEVHKANQEWDKVIWDKPNQLAYSFVKSSVGGIVAHHKMFFFLLTFGFGILGALMYILPDVVLLGPAGIKNNKIFQSTATNRGWIGILAFIYLVTFYIVLYFMPAFLVNQILIVDFVSKALSGGEASQWFLYGFLYCTVMSVMAVRMYVKYRNNAYQVFRTTVVLFFQLAFAFLIPEILVKFNMPWYDFKNAWPLNYTFFFDWNINNLLESGNMGMFMLVWGIALTLIIVPVMVYFFGKRWYCSWVCGCGGLAETLGDPYRQLSDKSLTSWKIERYLIHGVLGFAIIMTGATIYSFFTSESSIIGIQTSDVQSYYGFLIGSIFSGVIGTGFYPVMGNRVWCRFGCPLAAYMGFVQRFKSRFRITTNGAQCISCGNCSTYCEQGIDVRWYAQRGQNIVRSSCVGCGICSAVCPRGVLKLENGLEEGRINDNPILIGDNNIEIRI